MKCLRERTQALLGLTPTLTAVSHRDSTGFEKSATNPLAWGSLVLGLTMALSGAGCMVTGSPDFSQPKMTAPFLTAEEPVAWAVKIVTGMGSIPSYKPDKVRFRVLSEDLNQKLLAALVLDYRGHVPEGEHPMDFPPVQKIDPGHLDPNDMGPPRSVEMPYTLPSGIQAGCHSLTVIATHQFDETTINPSSEDDFSTLTWWLAVQDPLGEPLDLSSCVAMIGGADGGSP